MDRTIEADWRAFRELSRVALDRLCARILAEIAEIAADSAKPHCERFRAVYAHVMERDDDIAYAFDGPSRSRMLEQLVMMVSLSVVTDDELARFSDDTRTTVIRALDMRTTRE